MRRASAMVGILLAAVGLAACGSSSPSTTGSTSATSAASTSTTAGSSRTSFTFKPESTSFFKRSGKGDKRAGSLTTTARWRLIYDFDCTTTEKKDRRDHFALELTPSGRSTVTAATRHGTTGGGTRTYGPGTYSLSVTTPCHWAVEAQSALRK